MMVKRWKFFNTKESIPKFAAVGLINASQRITKRMIFDKIFLSPILHFRFLVKHDK